MSTPVSPPEPYRRKKRIYIPLILLALLMVVAIGCFVRGIWADTVIRDPATPAEGPITQLLRKQNGNVVVRCAVIVNAPPKDVWAVVSGYEKYHDFIPHISKVNATPQPDSLIRIEGIAHSGILGDWPFQCLVVHKESPEEGDYAAFWEKRDIGAFKLDRGTWNLSPLDRSKTQTLLVLTLQIELKHYPDFIARNILLNRLPGVLKAMRDEAITRQKA